MIWKVLIVILSLDFLYRLIRYGKSDVISLLWAIKQVVWKRKIIAYEKTQPKPDYMYEWLTNDGSVTKEEVRKVNGLNQLPDKE